MIDLKKAKRDLEAYKKNIKDRNLSIDFDAFLELESEKNTLGQELDEMRNTKNVVSKEIPTLKDEAKIKKISEMKEL